MSQSIAEGVYVEKGSSITITVSTGTGATPTEAPEDGEGGDTAQEPGDTSGTWKCTQTLDTPATYTGGMVKMELVQEVDGSPAVDTIMEGKTIDFPYQLDITGEPGVSEGTLYLYEQIDSDYVELGHYPISFQKAE